MINKFSQFLVEEEKTVYFTFGRMNPPTIGHGKLLDVLASKAGRNPYRVFLSHSQDKNKNPLQYKDKVKHVRKMFPKHARSIMSTTSVKTAIDALVSLYNEGFIRVVMVVGSDRIIQFDTLLNKYNGVKSRHGFYNFKSIKVISAGERDPDADGVEGMSASKLRVLAKDNDFTSFSQGLPRQFSNSDSRNMFNLVRKGMGLKEENEFKRHIQLEPVSEIREAYVRDGLFEKGDEVVMLKHDIVGNIQHLGTNYVIVESKGETWRCWITDIEKTDPNTQVKWDNFELKSDDDDGIIREEYKYSDGTPEATKHAKKMTPGQNERKLTPGEIKKREKYAKDLPDKDFKKRYGDEWMQVKMATATKMAKKESTQDSDIKDRPGTQPARYHKGLSKATKIARDRHFKKHGKKADNDSSAYTPAPGDKRSVTSPSKYTKFVKRLMK